VKLPSGGSDDDPTDEAGESKAAETHDAHGDDHHGIHLPSPSYYPMILALGIPCIGYAMVFRGSANLLGWGQPWLGWFLGALGVFLLLFGLFGWGLEPSVDEEGA